MIAAGLFLVLIALIIIKRDVDRHRERMDAIIRAEMAANDGYSATGHSQAYP